MDSWGAIPWIRGVLYHGFDSRVLYHGFDLSVLYHGFARIYAHQVPIDRPVNRRKSNYYQGCHVEEKSTLKFVSSSCLRSRWKFKY